MYGNKNNNNPVNERSSLEPGHYYAYSKFIGEKMIETYSKINNLNFIILRFFNIYGPKSNAVISTFLAQKLQKKIITIFGSGKQRRDFLYIDDLCVAVLNILKNKKLKNKIYNLGSGKSISINELKKKLFYKKSQKLNKRDNDIEVSIANISKIKRDLNWLPKTEIHEGIKKTLDKDRKRLKILSLFSIQKLKDYLKAQINKLNYFLKYHYCKNII